MMRYLPKSKLGAVVAGLYLLLMSMLLFVIGTNEPGGHGDPTPLIVGLVFILTCPLSWAAVWIWDVSRIESTNQTVGFVTMFVIFVVSVIFNTAIIYLAVGFLSRAVRSLFGKANVFGEKL